MMKMMISCLVGHDVHLILVMIGTSMLRLLRRFQLMILMTISCPLGRNVTSLHQRIPDDPDHADDDPDHADDIFQNIYPTTIPRTRDSVNYSDWQRMNRNFSFQPLY